MFGSIHGCFPLLTRSVQGAAAIAFVLAIAGLGCSFEPGEAPLWQCFTDQECLVGESCRGNLCMPRAEIDAAGAGDLVESDAGSPPQVDTGSVEPVPGDTGDGDAGVTPGPGDTEPVRTDGGVLPPEDSGTPDVAQADSGSPEPDVPTQDACELNPEGCACLEGAPCTTNKPGVCGSGTWTCAGGSLECRADEDPTGAFCELPTNMVFVPGGTFIMGSTQSEALADPDEKPQHRVSLAPFYIDRFEVSRSAYARCLAGRQCSALDWRCPYQRLSGSDGDKPVVCVSYEQARRYCAAQGKYLPTEAQWEKAARGPDPRAVIWPWGNDADPAKARMGCQGTLNECVVPVNTGAVGASYYGAVHMAGNAAEYVQDFYDPNLYGPALRDNPLQNTDLGLGRVVRGGSYRQALEFGRVANRAADRNFTVGPTEIGFRCASDAP